jgi:hypothetical protein
MVNQYFEKIREQTYLLSVLGILGVSFLLSVSLGRTFWSLPLGLILLVVLILGALSRKIPLLPKPLKLWFQTKPELATVVAVILSMLLMGIGLYFSVAGPFANKISAQFFGPVFLYSGYILLGGFLINPAREQGYAPFAFLPVVMGLGFVIMANKLFNVYGLAILAHLLAVQMLIIYSLSQILFDKKKQAAVLKNLLLIFLPILILLLSRGMLQMMIRYYFQSGLILNHNYTTVGLTLGILVPVFYSKNNFPAWSVMPAWGIPFGLLALFFGEVAVVYLLTLSFSSFVFSWLDREKHLIFGGVSFFSVLLCYLTRDLLLDKPALPVDTRLIIAGVLLSVTYGLYVWQVVRGKKAVSR